MPDSGPAADLDSVPCQPGDVPPHRACQSLEGDLDGDGVLDQLSVVGAKGEEMLQLERGTGEVSRLPLVQSIPKPFIVGLHDLDGKPGLEAFVMVEFGANTGRVWIVRATEDRLLPVSLSGNPDPFDVALGGAANHVHGFRCWRSGQERRLDVVSARRETQHAWAWQKTSYRLRGDVLERVREDSGHVDEVGEGALPADVNPGANCGRLRQFRF